MSWKVIGASIAGTAHNNTGRGCDDACQFISRNDGNLIVCVSDGAGSASKSAFASDFCCASITDAISALLDTPGSVKESDIYSVLEATIADLLAIADQERLPPNEYSCTILGAVLTQTTSLFFQIGDGAIIRADESGYYNCVCWPQNGEYANTTFFLTDEKALANLQIVHLQEAINQVAVFTDGLQLLALNMELRSVHQPFFTGLFYHLKQADNNNVPLLQARLEEYLKSNQINQRTDDDKTLVLAVRSR